MPLAMKILHCSTVKRKNDKETACLPTHSPFSSVQPHVIPCIDLQDRQYTDCRNSCGYNRYKGFSIDHHQIDMRCQLFY